jgi:hypothetical protein
MYHSTWQGDAYTDGVRKQRNSRQGRDERSSAESPSSYARASSAWKHHFHPQNIFSEALDEAISMNIPHNAVLKTGAISVDERASWPRTQVSSPLKKEQETSHCRSNHSHPSSSSSGELSLLCSVFPLRLVSGAISFWAEHRRRRVVLSDEVLALSDHRPSRTNTRATTGAPDSHNNSSSALPIFVGRVSSATKVNIYIPWSTDAVGSHFFKHKLF